MVAVDFEEKGVVGDESGDFTATRKTQFVIELAGVV